MNQPNSTDMIKAWVSIIENLQKHGLSITILAIAVYVLNQQGIANQEKLEICNDKIVTMYQKQNQEQRGQNAELIRVLDKNTDAINTFSEIVKDLK